MPFELVVGSTDSVEDFVPNVDRDMVHIGIPKHYTASPSSLSHTPSLTINRDVALDLDSSNAFEG